MNKVHVVTFHGDSSGGLQSYLVVDNSFHNFGFRELYMLVIGFVLLSILKIYLNYTTQ